MTFRDAPCSSCHMPVLHAQQVSGLPVVCELDPVLTGVWKLTERVGRLPLASKPTAKFAFGVKLYPVHTCARKWTKK